MFDYNDALQKGGYIENWLIRLMKEGNTLNREANALELVKKTKNITRLVKQAQIFFF